MLFDRLPNRRLAFLDGLRLSGLRENSLPPSPFGECHDLSSTVVALIVSIAFASHSTADDAKPQKTELEGTWNAVKKDNRAQQLKFTGNKFEAKIGDKVFKGTLTINTDETPSTIDLKITESEEKKRLS